MNESESEESACPLTKASSRVVGAELIRQLSCHKLEKFHQSDETLHQYVAAKRKTGAPIIKRFSDNHHDRRHRPVTVVKAVSERPALTRQSTSNNSESVMTGAVTADNRRHHLATVKDHRNWRSCEASQPQVAGTHRRTGQFIGQTSPSSLHLAASFNSLSAAGQQATTTSSHLAPISPSAQSRTTSTVNHLNELSSQEQEQDTCQVPPPQLEQHQEPVRYYSGQRAGQLGDGQEEDRVVLPPLAGNLVISTKNSKLLSQRMAKVAGSRTKKVLAKQPATCPAKTNRRRHTNKAAPGAVAMAAIAVAVVTGNDASSDVNNGPNPRRRARGIVILTSVFLLFTCLFLVGITLRLAPLIDELGKISFLDYSKLIHSYVTRQAGRAGL